MTRAYEVEKDWTAHGLRCVAIAGITTGHRCGYVGLPREHPLYGVHYEQGTPVLREMFERAKRGDIGERGVIPLVIYAMQDEGKEPTPDIAFDVHGSITYSEADPKYPVESDGLWWYGFDCGHCDDAPDLVLLRKTEVGRRRLAIERKFLRDMDRVVRDLAFVTMECEKLAEQLASLMPEAEPEAAQNTKTRRTLRKLEGE